MKDIAGKRKHFDLCRHCGKRKANRGRGLCGGCHGCSSTRRVCEPPGRDCSGGRGLMESMVEPVVSPSPTLALPGTEAKILEMQRRVANGLKMYSGEDGKPDCR